MILIYKLDLDEVSRSKLSKVSTRTVQTDTHAQTRPNVRTTAYHSRALAIPTVHEKTTYRFSLGIANISIHWTSLMGIEGWMRDISLSVWLIYDAKQKNNERSGVECHWLMIIFCNTEAAPLRTQHALELSHLDEKIAVRFVDFSIRSNPITIKLVLA